MLYVKLNFKILVRSNLILASFDIHVSDKPGVQNQARCFGTDPVIGRYIPVGTYNSRVLYQRDGLNNGFAVIMYYNTASQKWNFVSNSRSASYLASKDEFDDNILGSNEMTV